MTDCRRTADRLAQYVDETLAPDERGDVERHLDACPECRASASHEAGARRVLRARADRLRAAPLPPGLRSRCEAIVREQSQSGSRGAWLRRIVPIAATALLVVFAGAAILSVVTGRSNTVLAAQLAADHVKCFRAFAPADAPAADARGVESMFRTEYGWDVHVPASPDEEELRLIGGRRCLYADGRIPHLLYRVDGEDVSLFMLRGVTREAADVAAFGHRARVWTRGDTTFVLVSAASAGELAEAASFIMREAH